MENYNLVKLGDIISYENEINNTTQNNEGISNYYGNSNIIGKCDIADYNEEYLIIHKYKLYIYIDNCFSCSGNYYIIKSNYNKYLYHLIKNNMYLLNRCYDSITLNQLSKTLLNNLEIPILNTEELLNDWLLRIDIPYNNIISKQNELNETISTQMKSIIDNEECKTTQLDTLCDINYNKNSKYKCEGNKIIFNTSYRNMELIIRNNNLQQYIYYYLIHNNIDIIGFTSQIPITLPVNTQSIDNLEPFFNNVKLVQIEINNLQEEYNKIISEIIIS